MTGFSEMIDGYRRFRETDWMPSRERWAELATAQAPKVMIVGCSDSRIEPSRIFDTSPGEMFVVRNVANLVPPFETGGGLHGVSAALEFAVTQLEVAEIVVLGHGGCGGVDAALSRRFKNAERGAGGFIADWISLLDEARERVIAAHGHEASAIRALELETVKVGIANLRTFPCIQQREAKGRLTIHGAYFALGDGVLHILDESTGEFAPA